MFKGQCTPDKPLEYVHAQIMEADFNRARKSPQLFTSKPEPVAFIKLQKKADGAIGVFCGSVRGKELCKSASWWRSSAPCLYPSQLEQEEMRLAGQALQVKVSFTPGTDALPGSMKLECYPN